MFILRFYGQALCLHHILKEIQLSQGQVALVEDNWFEELNQFKWYARWCEGTRTFYAQRNLRAERREDRRLLLMHIHVDHKDGDGLHNWIPNIRLDPFRQNSQNRGLQKNNTSGFKGVCWVARTGNWIASIRFHGRSINLGRYSNILGAAEAYNMAALKYFGEFSVLNVIPSEWRARP